MNPGYAIEAHVLSKHFGDLKAVSELDLKVPRGQRYGFLGPKGSGKSTTLYGGLKLLAEDGRRKVITVEEPTGTPRRCAGRSAVVVSVDPAQIETAEAARGLGGDAQALADLAEALALAVDEAETGLDGEAGASVERAEQLVEQRGELVRDPAGVVDHADVAASERPAPHGPAVDRGLALVAQPHRAVVHAPSVWACTPLTSLVGLDLVVFDQR